MPLALAALSIAALSITVEASTPPQEHDLSCLRPEMARASTATLVTDAVATLRRAGPDPAAYELELRSVAPTNDLELVFTPRRDPLRYALAVRADDPCAVRWLWQPERFTPWQRAVLDRARVLLAGSAGAPGAELVAVDVFEARDAVTVELRHAGGGDAGTAVAESRVTLLKRDVAIPAGVSRGEP